MKISLTCCIIQTIICRLPNPPIMGITPTRLSSWEDKSIGVEFISTIAFPSILLLIPLANIDWFNAINQFNYYLRFS